MRNKGLRVGPDPLDPDPIEDGFFHHRARGCLFAVLLAIVSFAVGMTGPASMALERTETKRAHVATPATALHFAPGLNAGASQPILQLEPDARHCTSEEITSCGCGMRGVKECAVGTIGGKMTTLCECNPTPRPSINPNLQVRGGSSVARDFSG